jgi:hypothetical protein
MGHFNISGLAASKTDVGFRSEFRDDYLYASPWDMEAPHSTQLGHFITAMDMGYNSSLSTGGQVIAREQHPDTDIRSYLGGFPLFLVDDADIVAFEQAAASDLQGNPLARDYWLATIMDEDRFGPQSGRRGNSMEDLRLTVKGWEVGREIAAGRLKTSGEVADWIIRNVADWWY